MYESVLVFCGGNAPSESTLALIGPHDFVIAADSGIDHALRAGFSIDIAVGDFDSVSIEGLEAAKKSEAVISQHPPNKNATDFELALECAVDSGAAQITVVAIDGGRLDHQLANLLALADPKLKSARLRAFTETETITVIHDSATLNGKPGTLVSLLPIGGDVENIVTAGLTYPLNGETLKATSSRGISNIFNSDVATVTITSGALLAIELRS